MKLSSIVVTNFIIVTNKMHASLRCFRVQFLQITSSNVCSNRHRNNAVPHKTKEAIEQRYDLLNIKNPFRNSKVLMFRRCTRTIVCKANVYNINKQCHNSVASFTVSAIGEMGTRFNLR